MIGVFITSVDCCLSVDQVEKTLKHADDDADSEADTATFGALSCVISANL